ncbi:MAG: ATP phosphoribosyltransferase [Tannerellaceae bacterium]|jgi:ATP phosphoribosyltransferase|nr:ATP phosphoribosyltransferase [Tannerellaceae bacterium]
MLRIALQSKGRLSEQSLSLLDEAGIRLNRSKRTLLVACSGFPVEALLLRDDDIPLSVAGGVADAGIVGENEYVEKGSPARLVKRLGFSRCRLSLAIPRDEAYKDVSWFEGKTIATSYPNILTAYLKERGVKASLHVISGSVEIAPGIGLADAIFDIVSSGSTLSVNHLKEVESVMESEALLIANPSLDSNKSEALDGLLFRLEAVLTASGKKYVLLNAPKERLNDIAALLPGMKSPTVTLLAGEGWVSVQSVIAEDRFWEIIGKLKALGAEGIIIIPIEKMIL